MLGQLQVEFLGHWRYYRLTIFAVQARSYRLSGLIERSDKSCSLELPIFSLITYRNLATNPVTCL